MRNRRLSQPSNDYRIIIIIPLDIYVY